MHVYIFRAQKTAGTRARKMLQQVKGKAQDLRNGIQETKRQMDLQKSENDAGGGMNLEGSTNMNQVHTQVTNAQIPVQQQVFGGGGMAGAAEDEFTSDGNSTSNNMAMGLPDIN